MPDNVAGIGKRMLGGIIDLALSVIIIGFLGVFSGDTHVLSSSSGSYGLTISGPTLIWGGAVNIAIFTYLEFKFSKTLGKLIAGTKVVAETGDKIILKQAIIRNVLRLIDGIFLYLAGLVIISFDKNHQRLGDLMAKTIVVRG